MGNRNIVMDESGKVIGEYNTSLACFALVRGLVEKYNPTQIDSMMNPDKINEILKPVYDQCQPWETMELLLYLNDESEFGQDDIPALDEAIEKYSFGNEGPKKHLVFMWGLLDKYQKVKTKYMDTTMAMMIMSA